ncbi:MAG: rod-binding protein [SAR324 cluster bacterium]|nr:rod-binding protein [SAR324 cluster bacterium]
MDINQDLTLIKMRANTTLGKRTLTSATETDQVKKFNRDLKKATEGFEELFVHKMLQVMRKSVPKTDLMSGGRGEEIFEDMLDQNYAKIIAESKAFGLSQVIYKQNKK